jgi:hypothetical protein
VPRPPQRDAAVQGFSPQRSRSRPAEGHRSQAPCSGVGCSRGVRSIVRPDPGTVHGHRLLWPSAALDFLRCGEDPGTLTGEERAVGRSRARSMVQTLQRCGPAYGTAHRCCGIRAHGVSPHATQVSRIVIMRHLRDAGEPAQGTPPPSRGGGVPRLTPHKWRDMPCAGSPCPSKARLQTRPTLLRGLNRLGEMCLQPDAAGRADQHQRDHRDDHQIDRRHHAAVEMLDHPGDGQR